MPSSSASSVSDNEFEKKKGWDEKEYDSDGNELYVVERICDKKMMRDPDNRNNKIWMYHLKWKGYGEGEKTWEPKSNMDCPDLLEEFEKEWKVKQEKERKRKEREEREEELRRSEKYLKHNKDKHKSPKAGRRSSFDSDYDTSKPSSSGVSRDDIRKSDKKKKRSHSSDSDSEADRKKRKHSMSTPKSKKISKKDSDSDSEEDKKRKKRVAEKREEEKRKKKVASDSDSDSDAKSKAKKTESEPKKFESEAEKKIMSKPGPKRAKEAALKKLKEMETQPKPKPKDSDDESDSKSKPKKKLDSDSDDDSKTKKKESEEDNDVKKKIMSKPGPKRAKEARLQKAMEEEKKAMEEEKKAKEKPKAVDSDDEKKTTQKKKEYVSDSDDEKTPTADKKADKEEEPEKEELAKKIRPGPKRAKEAQMAKLKANSTPKPEEKKKTVVEELIDNDSNDKNSSSSWDTDDKNKKETEKPKSPTKSPSKQEKPAEEEKEEPLSARLDKVLLKPGPKRAKEAQMARLSKAASEDSSSNSVISKKSDDKESDKEEDNKSDDEESQSTSAAKKDETTKSVEKSSPKKSTNDEQRKSVLSRPGPKRAKEARLKRLNDSLQTSGVTEPKDDSNSSNSNEETTKKTNGLSRRAGSTDSLDAIISTPAPEEESMEMEKELVAEIESPAGVAPEPLTNGGVDSDENSRLGAGDTADNLMDGLTKIGNSVTINSSKYLSQISNALSLAADVEMKRPGFISKRVSIKPFRTDRKADKIISAFYCNENKLCFLMKYSATNKCEVVLSDDVSQHNPKLVIDFYQSNLHFT